MNAPSLLTFSGLASLALASNLMADKPAPDLAQREAKPAPQPRIAICKSVPAPSVQVKELKDMEANEESIESILKNEEVKTTIEKLNAPIVLNSMEEALKHLTRASMEKIADVVDFDKQQVAIFAWQGSGQDRLQGHLASGDGAATTFQYTPGMTKDLRDHRAIYVMAKDTKMSVIKMERRFMRCGNEQLEGRPGIQLQIEPMKLENGEQLKLELKVQPKAE